jgi:hypothetical protein
MARLRLPAALLAVLLGTGGCLGWETRLVLEPDGTGTGEVRAVHDAKAAAALRTRVEAQVQRVLAASSDPGGGVAPAPKGATDGSEPDPVAPGWLRAAARGVRGLELLEVAAAPEVGIGDGPPAPGVEAKARFDSLEAAARGGLFHGCEVALERRPKKRFLFTVRPPWMPSGPGADDAWGGVASTLLPPFAADVAGLRQRVVITFPLPVVATNGTLSDDRRTVTFEARGDDAPARRLEVELELSDEEPWTTFRHRPDLGALARRLIVPPPPVPEDVPWVDGPSDAVPPAAAPGTTGK